VVIVRVEEPAVVAERDTKKDVVSMVVVKSSVNVEKSVSVKTVVGKMVVVDVRVEGIVTIVVTEPPTERLDVTSEVIAEVTVTVVVVLVVVKRRERDEVVSVTVNVVLAATVAKLLTVAVDVIVWVVVSTLVIVVVSCVIVELTVVVDCPMKASQNDEAAAPFELRAKMTGSAAEQPWENALPASSRAAIPMWRREIIFGYGLKYPGINEDLIERVSEKGRLYI
jgi:hypothetical protein